MRGKSHESRRTNAEEREDSPKENDLAGLGVFFSRQMRRFVGKVPVLSKHIKTL